MGLVLHSIKLYIKLIKILVNLSIVNVLSYIFDYTCHVPFFHFKYDYFAFEEYLLHSNKYTRTRLDTANIVKMKLKKIKMELQVITIE